MSQQKWFMPYVPKLQRTGISKLYRTLSGDSIPNDCTENERAKNCESSLKKQNYCKTSKSA